ncbi:uncharacterized protein LOC120499093 isoform X2 [Passer montanus]|uniref:uncharacterized protein LOC120499093 isoform X2 n=1 Tax=Passer montanus TaxID=9160 RepID=UPI0019610B3D|nr:uncharacterized protein LOC120499093 isoform X2 [Passer montanus]
MLSPTARASPAACPEPVARCRNHFCSSTAPLEAVPAGSFLFVHTKSAWGRSVMIFGSRASSALGLCAGAATGAGKPLSKLRAWGVQPRTRPGPLRDFFCRWKTPKARLGWDKEQGAERVWGPGGAGDRGTSPGLPAAPRARRGWLVTNPTFLQGKELWGPLIPRDSLQSSGSCSPGGISWTPGQQHQGLFGPQSSSVPAPGGCLGSSGMSFHGNKTPEEAHSIQLSVGSCSTRKGILEPPGPSTTRAGQPRRAGRLPRVLLSPGMPSAVHRSGRRPSTARPNQTTQTCGNPQTRPKPSRNAGTARSARPTRTGLRSHLRGSGHISGAQVTSPPPGGWAQPCWAKTREVVSLRTPFPNFPGRLCPSGPHFPISQEVCVLQDPISRGGCVPQDPISQFPRKVVSCRIPFPSRSIPGKGRAEAQAEKGQGREVNATLTLWAWGKSPPCQGHPGLALGISRDPVG